jgi:beta-lactam-binding protein with PASTA domain
MWKEFMVKVVENLPVVEWPADPSDLEKYYEIPTVEIPQLIGLNVLDAEEIAFSSYLLPKIILTESDEVPGLVLTQNIEAGTEVPEGTELVVEVSGKTFSAPIPNLPPCTYTADEAEELLKEFMRDSNVILFILRNYESTDVQGCEGKVIGTNVAQGATVSTGDTIILIIKGNTSP